MQQTLFKHASQGGRQVCWLPLDKIIPRDGISFSSDMGVSLSELTASILRFGLLEPINVTQSENGFYEIISGNRRYYACRMAGFSHIDALIMPSIRRDSTLPLLIHSLSNESLHFFEEAEAMEMVLNACPITQDELSRRLNKSASYITNKLRLLKLEKPLRNYIVEMDLTERHARALLRLPDNKSRLRIARRAAEEGLSVRDTELLVESALRRLPVPPPPKGRIIALMRDHRLYLNAIRGIVEQMQETGLDAQMDVSQSDTEMTLHITLPISNRGK